MCEKKVQNQLYLWHLKVKNEGKLVLKVIKRLFKNIDVLEAHDQEVVFLTTHDQVRAEEVLEIIETEAMVTGKLAKSDSFCDLDRIPYILEQLSLLFEVAEHIHYEKKILTQKKLRIPYDLYVKRYYPSKAQILLPVYDPPLHHEELKHTASVFLQCNLNVTDAAHQLYVHRNTLLYRLNKIKQLTGYDLRQFQDAMHYYYDEVNAWINP